MTPFYTALSVWVGALLMVSLLTVDNKHKSLEPVLTTRQVFLGKAGFFIMLGMLQALIVSVGDLLILKAGVESPVLFVPYNDFLFDYFQLDRIYVRIITW